MARITLALLALFLLACAVQASILTPEKMLSMERLSSFQAHPHGHFTLSSRHWNFASKTWESSSSINATLANQAALTTICSGKAAALQGQIDMDISQSVWDHTGRFLFFLTNTSQISVLDICSNQSIAGPQQLTNFDLPLDNLKIVSNHNATVLLFTAEVYPFLDQSVDPIRGTFLHDKILEKEGTSGQLYDDLMVRHWDRWNTHKHAHVFALPLFLTSNSTWTNNNAVAIDLMPGIKASSPVDPFGDLSHFDLSSNLEKFVFTVHYTEECTDDSDKSTCRESTAWTTNWNIYTLQMPGMAQWPSLSDASLPLSNASLYDSAKPRCITCDNRAMDQSPSFSPNGQYIAYVGMARPGFEADRQTLRIYDVFMGKTVIVSDKWDRSVTQLAWISNTDIVLTADDDASTKLYLWANATQSTAIAPTREVISTGSSGGLYVAGDYLYLTYSSMSKPANAYRIPLLSLRNTSDHMQQISYLNQEELDKLELAQPAKFYFNDAEGQQVQGWVLDLRTEFSPSENAQKKPLALLIHGGPQGSWGDSWSTRWNPQVFAAAGYLVAAINPFGSTGFGQDFTDAVSGEWGGRPFQQLMRGVDHLLVHPTFGQRIDHDRLVALGASYGGYMINWINTQTDRFRALVCHDGVLDQRMMYFGTEELWFNEWEMATVDSRPMPYFKDPSVAEKWSPVNYIQHAKTPELVIHGGKDYRIPESQGLGMFTALRRMGVPSQLLYFPDESHLVLKPGNSLKWHKTILAWLERHLE